MIRVLYIDDEPNLLSLCKMFLERKHDLAIDTTTTAEEGLMLLSVNRYDIIVSDYQMPGMDGISLLVQVRKTFGDIPFIIFTGTGREEIVIDAINNGADFYLQKGGDPKSQFADLENKIRQAFRRARAEQELFESKKRLEDIINFLPDPTFAIDRDGRVIAWNRAIEELMGVTAGCMIGRGNYEYTLPFYHVRKPILIDLLFEGGDITPLGYSNVTRERDHLIADIEVFLHDGRKMVLMGNASPLYNPQGEVTGAIESIRDITDIRMVEKDLVRKNQELKDANIQFAAAEEALRRNLEELRRKDRALSASEERFRLLFDNSPSMLLMLDAEGVICSINEFSAIQLGYMAEELVGRPVTSILHPADREVIGEKMTSLIRSSGKVFYEQMQTCRKDGSTFWVEVYARAMPDLAGSPCILAVCQNITKRKMSEEALERAIRKFRLLSGITRHDLLNQLVVLNGLLELSEDALYEPATQENLISEEKTIVSRIEKLLAFTRDYQDLGLDAPCWQNVDTCIEKAVFILPEKKVRVDIDCAGLEIFADPLLERVFHNLTGNAVSHGGPGLTSIHISSRLSPDGIIITFQDDGIGIADDDRKHLFDRGFGKHTGLGLFLIREILRITGITISENGEYGRGARFEMVVPEGAYRFVQEQVPADLSPGLMS